MPQVRRAPAGALWVLPTAGKSALGTGQFPAEQASEWVNICSWTLNFLWERWSSASRGKGDWSETCTAGLCSPPNHMDKDLIWVCTSPVATRAQHQCCSGITGSAQNQTTFLLNLPYFKWPIQILVIKSSLRPKPEGLLIPIPTTLSIMWGKKPTAGILLP